MVGGFLSTLLPVIGPAVLHSPTVLHTWRLFVAAFAVSVPIGTLVVKLKLASAAFASPDSGSLAVEPQKDANRTIAQDAISTGSAAIQLASRRVLLVGGDGSCETHPNRSGRTTRVTTPSPMRGGFLPLCRYPVSRPSSVPSKCGDCGRSPSIVRWRCANSPGVLQRLFSRESR